MIASGQAGGMPHAGFAETYDALDGSVVMPIEMVIDGRRSRLRIPGIMDFQLTPLTDPVSGEEKEVRIVYPGGGFEWPEGNICTTATMSVTYGDFQFACPSKWAAYATLEWSNSSQLATHML